ncbi:putative membrane associated protein [Granulibacter bethesdensis]|uniref:Membrane associated protein n=1 Tax=Granulibacter bethesdensis TaxID=364410 RepID=A0AAN0RFK8_9PROT|nr:putative membrane associated protein [Granulibacter bethesdensis]
MPASATTCRPTENKRFIAPRLKQISRSWNYYCTRYHHILNEPLFLSAMCGFTIPMTALVEKGRKVGGDSAQPCQKDAKLLQFRLLRCGDCLMLRYVLAVFLGMASLGLSAEAHAQSEQQAIVDRATLTVQDMLGPAHSSDRINTLKRARAVMICPQSFRAAFIFGGAGASCVLSARDGAGSWSAPAFFSMSSVSFGLQIGIQDSQIMLMIMNDKALSAIMDKQFKFGGDASLSVATFGAGVEGDVTAALRADIIGFSKSRGLFGSVALNGTFLTTDTDANRAYYGQALAARQIVIQMQVNNPGADPLRTILARYGTPGQAAAAPVAAGQPTQTQEPAYAPAPVTGGPTRLAPVQQQTLPPPR